MNDEYSTSDAELHQWTSLQAILWNVRLSSLYHQRRANHWRWSGKIIDLVIGAVGVGAALLIEQGGQATSVATGIVLVVPLLVVLQSVLRFDEQIANHTWLSKAFLELEHDLAPAAATNDTSIQQVVQFQQRSLRIQRDEPSALSVVLLECHNELMIANGRPGYVYPIPAWARLVGAFIELDTIRYRSKPTPNPTASSTTANVGV